MNRGTVFIDREEELSDLLSFIKNNIDVIIYGVRGIGKTTLLEKLVNILKDKGFDVIYISGYIVTLPSDISSLLGIEQNNPKLILSELIALDDKVIIIDEFVSFLRAFVTKRYFPSLGSVTKFFRSLIEKRRKRGGHSIILCSSAIGMVKRLTKKYFAPLFRQFKIYQVGPLSLSDAVKLAEKYCGEYALETVNLVGGSPFYVLKMCEEVRLGHKPREALQRLLEDPSGDLNIYFEALYDKFSPQEKYILHLLARGVNRYSHISEKTTVDPMIYLKRLMIEGIVKKVEVSPKEVYYKIMDKVFEAWLALHETPSLGKISIKTLVMSSLGFEALVREMFGELNTSIEVTDENGQKTRIDKPRKVMRYQKGDVEIDGLLIYQDGVVIIECHFWGPAKPEKIQQIQRIGRYVEQVMGLKIKESILISYFGFQQKTRQLAKANGIKLFSARQLQQIQKITRKYWGF